MVRRTPWHSLLDWIYPRRCAGCDDPLGPGETGFCGPCRDSLVALQGSRCRRCGTPSEAATCVSCQRAPPPFATVTSGFAYGGALAAAVRRYKYGGRLEVAETLAWLLWPLVQGRAGVLVPVPSARQALAVRGMDCMAFLLERLQRVARCHGAQISVRPLLARQDRRPPQASLRAAERGRLSARAFRVRRRGSPRGLPLVLVDDVLTTGATVRACAGALVLAGLGPVQVVTLARAERSASEPARSRASR